MADFNLFAHLKPPFDMPYPLLVDALDIIQAQLPAVTAGQVIRPGRGGFILWASTGGDAADNRDFMPAETHPLYRRALDDDAPVSDDRHIITPLHLQDEVIALLDLTISDTGETSDKPAAETIQMIAHQLSAALTSSYLDNLFQQQMTATAQINTCETFDDVAAALAENILQPHQFVAIIPFDFDDDRMPIAARVLTSANRRQSYSDDRTIKIDPEYIQTVYHVLQRDGEVLSSSIDSDDRLTDESRAWLREQHVHSLYLLPLTVADEIRGSIAFIDTQRPLALNNRERRMYRTLVQQASNLIEKRRLLDTTAANLREQQTLYQLSSELVSARNVPDILHTLYDVLLPDLHSIHYSENDYDGRTIKEITVRYVYDSDGLQQTDAALHDTLPDDDFAALVARIHDMDDAPVMVEDYDDAGYKLPVTPEAEPGIESAIIIPIVEDGLCKQQISLAWTVSRTFDSQMHRILTAAQSQITLILQNQRLLELSRRVAQESGQQAQILRRLNELMTEANDAQDEQMMLDEAAKLLVQTTQADHVGIVLTNPVNPESGYVASEHPPLGIVGQTIPTSSNTIIGKLRQQGSFIRLKNLRDDDELSESDRATLERANAEDGFFVPMFDLRDELIGSVGVDYYDSDVEISPETFELAQTIASQIAINLQKLRLLRDSQQRADQMQSIANFSQSVQATLQTTDILHEAVKSSQDILAIDHVCILLHERGSNALHRTAYLSDGTIEVEQPGTPVTEDDNSISHSVWETRQLIHVEDIQSDWEWTHPQSATLRTILAAPLLAGGVSLGVMEVGSTNPGAYATADIAAFRQITSQLAVALTNAAAYAQSQKLARNKSLANEIIATLQEQTTVESILQVTARELGKALGARRARIRLSSETPTTTAKNEQTKSS